MIGFLGCWMVVRGVVLGEKRRREIYCVIVFYAKSSFRFFFFVLNCFLVLCCVCKVFFGKRKYYVRNRQGGCDKKVLVEKGGFVTTVFFGYFEELIKISFLLGVEGQNLKGMRESFYCGFLCRKAKRIVCIL